VNAIETPICVESFESLLQGFLDESTRLIERLKSSLVQLVEWTLANGDANEAACDPEPLNSMYRSAHSIQGLSSILELREVHHVTHEIKSVVNAARAHELGIGDAVERLAPTIDRLVALVEALHDRSVATVIQGETTYPTCARVLHCENTSKPPMQPPVTSPAPLTSDLSGATCGEALAAPIGLSPQAALSAAAQTAAGESQLDDFAGIQDESDIPTKYLSIFVDETILALDALTETLLNLEATGGRKAVEEVLITSHRIKGSAACVGLNRAAKLAHYMEDLVQRLRDQAGDLTPVMADAMLKCTDALRTYTEGLKKGSPDSSGFARAAADLLSAQIVQPAASPEAVIVAPPTAASSAFAESATSGNLEVAPRNNVAPAGLSDQLRARVLTHMTVRGNGLYGVVAFTRGLPLVGLKARLVHEKLSHLGEVFLCEPAANTLDELEDLDSLTFGVATDAGIEVARRQLRIAGVERVDVASLSESSQSDDAPSGAIAAPQNSATTCPPATQQTSATSTTSATNSRLPERRASNSAAASSQEANVGDSAPADSAKGTTEAGGKPTETLRVDIERLDQLMNLAGQLVINKARFSRIGDSLKQATSGKQAGDSFAAVVGLLNKISASVDPSRSDRFSSTDLEGIRAHARRMQEHLDSMRVTLEQFAAVRGCVNDLGEAVHQLDRVADGIQKSVMDTRMVPIGPLFGRFRRVIRDMSRANGKDVRLVIHGEKTELDKRMIDELGDPLIHMVRNSADHGIESPEVREAAGKSREGTITLDAFQRGNSITIQVRDDGRGLDLERIRAKAIEKGIVTPADAEKLTTHQVYQLVWEPGFSTAEKVTEISGRGMGMDIVKSKIEDINGTVEIDSVPGEGTTLTIKLPLTLAILPSLMAQIEGDVFAFPVESVVEIVSVRTEDMPSVHGLPSAVVRGRVVSVASLSEIFTWVTPASQSAVDNSEETTLVIIGSEGREMGLTVDRLLGEEDIVIKSMAENYQNVYGIAGASILGDGRVALILDTGVLIEMASKAIAAKQALARCGT